MKNEEIAGTFYIDGEYRDGIYYPEFNRFEEESHVRVKNFFIPMAVNAHTHIGDSFISSEPSGTLEEIVGPGGFKLRELQNVGQDTLIGGMKNSIKYMQGIGTGSFFDYREAGSSGIESLKTIRENEQNSLILARPDDEEDIRSISSIVNGVGFSAISDQNVDSMKEMAKIARNLKLLVSTHYSENRYEPMEPLFELKPDLLIHCTSLSRNQLNELLSVTKNVAVTPRSNRFFGIDANYSELIEAGFNLMLGTDNVMTVSPNIYQEMDFLFRIQKNRQRISPENIMKIVFKNPYDFIQKAKVPVKRKWMHFKGIVPTPFQIVTKFNLFNPLEIKEVEL
ncbi:MAG: amidohydrolase family protein [Cuniculiplasma sp.]